MPRSSGRTRRSRGSSNHSPANHPGPRMQTSRSPSPAPLQNARTRQATRSDLQSGPSSVAVSTSKSAPSALTPPLHAASTQALSQARSPSSRASSKQGLAALLGLHPPPRPRSNLRPFNASLPLQRPSLSPRKFRHPQPPLQSCSLLRLHLHSPQLQPRFPRSSPGFPASTWSAPTHPRSSSPSTQPVLFTWSPVQTPSRPSTVPRPGHVHTNPSSALHSPRSVQHPRARLPPATSSPRTPRSCVHSSNPTSGSIFSSRPRSARRPSLSPGH
jgi:hypothetical protein